MAKFTASVSVGAVGAPSGLTIIEELTPEEVVNLTDARRKRWTEAVRKAVGLKPAFKPPATLQLRQLCDIEGSAKYTAQVEFVANLLARPPLWGNCELVLDCTDVGAAVVGMFEDENLEPISVVIHGGAETIQSGANKFRVPKQDLISCTQVALLKKSIEAPRALKDWEKLVDEFKNYSTKPQKKSETEFSARESARDHLVLATALGVWRRLPPGGRVIMTGVTDLGERFDQQLAADRAAYEAIGLRHPLDMRADDMKAEQAEKDREREKHLRLHNPSDEEIRVREALSAAMAKRAKGEP